MNDGLQVKFTEFKVGPFKASPPPSTPERKMLEWEMSVTGKSGGPGWLEVTYVDEDLRISRNHLGQLFILSRDKDDM